MLWVHKEDAEFSLMVGYKNCILMKNIPGFGIIFYDFACKWSTENAQLTTVPGQKRTEDPRHAQDLFFKGYGE